MKIHKSLLPLGWLYGLVVSARNRLFDMGVLHSQTFDMPTISVGNLAVGGTGKTPHVEYLLRLLKDTYHVAVLSRGYKRRTKGFVLASDTSTANDIGDEPAQIKHKFPAVTVAVDANRCEGIQQLTRQTPTQVVVLDDAFQHRYVCPGLSILLVEHERMYGDRMLPAGRLREPMSGMRRADIIVVSKCPEGMTEDDFEKAAARLPLSGHQQLFFSRMEYQMLVPLFGKEARPLDTLDTDTHVLLLTGIANPAPMHAEIARHTRHITSLTYGDHHAFTPSDINAIRQAFAALPSPAIIITTEKDAARLSAIQGLDDKVRKAIYQLPIQVKFLRNGEEAFNQMVMDYVTRHSGKETKKDEDHRQ